MSAGLEDASCRAVHDTAAHDIDTLTSRRGGIYRE